MTEEWHRQDYMISTDSTLVNLDVVHGFPRRSYWATDRPLEAVRRSAEHSMNFGPYRSENRLRSSDTRCCESSSARY